MSPGYFDSYPSDLDLSWDIATKPWTQISLHFVELDVKSLEEGCNEDYVIIMDMSSQRSLGRFCDQKKPSGLVVSSLNRMEIRFHSDSIRSGDGFLAEYSSYILIPDMINSTSSLGRRDERGVFYWNDGTPMSYTDWYNPPQGTEGERQPNGGSLEACTMLVFDSATSTDRSTNLWHDVACASPETKQFICETAASGALALPPCTEDEFACNNGQCIPASKRCDFISHCHDSSDEDGCVLELSQSAFQCYDGSLFPRQVHCDGVIDCIGNTNEDESECAYSTPGDACDSATDITCNNGACASHTTRCLHKLDEYGFFTGCRDVTHLRACGNFECPESYLKCPSSYCIPLRYRCDGKMDCPSGEDEAFCDEYECPDGSYRCHGQHYCIGLDHVCDDIIHCPERDDEEFCDQCPQGCECDALSYSCHPDQVDFRLLPRQLRKLSVICDELDGPCDSSLSIVTNDDVTEGTSYQLMPLLMPYLISLYLEASFLEEIQQGSFLENKNLLNLNLARNSIRSLFRGTFDGLHRMKTLNLSGNPLTVVEAGAFGNLTHLQELDLRGTAITVTTDTGRDMFHGLKHLKNMFVF
ncbi:prolow-density lipoprotein receptor-related protein 1-like [Strongylocentrotus purpuratus]|uniref:Uncharacterized protein n=1 Tax=Strongylocentrotus purpuratus TaxID=7668 RepID=A0A7M7PF24_STRPU|nr:prolow-density lipoprotein receptor-related protein 1-like [Strongylocentrotus purpuratus]